MDMKQYPAKRRNRKHQSKISGDKTMNVQNTNDEVQSLINKTDAEKQALMEYAGLFASFEAEVKRVLGKEAPENTEEVLAISNDDKCKEAMDNMSKAYFEFVEKFGYSPEFACTVVDVIPAVRELATLAEKGLFKQSETEVNMTEAKEAVTTATEVVKETVEEVAEATNEAVEAATKAVEKAADAVTDTVDSAKVVAIEAIDEADEVVESVTAKAETGEEVSIDLVIEEAEKAPVKRELSDEEKAQIKAEAEAKAKAEVERLTEEARRSQNPLAAAWDFIKSPFSKA